MNRDTFRLPKFGIGGGPIGGITAGIDNQTAHAVLSRAWEEGIRYFDTAPWYGNTNSEHRVGAFLREKPRADFILTSKVGRLYDRPAAGYDFEASPWRKRWPGGLPMVPRFDYTYDGIMRSFEDSLQRLGINRLDALAIHDLDVRHHKTDEQVAFGLKQLTDGGGYRALRQLKDAGEIRAIGVGINLSGYVGRFLERFDIDYFLIAMPYTLASQEALGEEFPLCARHGARVVVGAPFASGILASGNTADARFAYGPAPADIREKVARIEETCRRHGVTLAAAALQFPLAHPVVAAVVFGADTPDQVGSNVRAMAETIPAAFWDDLKAGGLLAPETPTPGHG